MTTINRYRVPWTGFAGAPGVSTFYTVPGGATDVATALRVMFNSIKTYIPAVVTWTFPTAIDQIDDATGQLVGATTSVGAASLSGTGGGNWAAPAGCMIRWVTGAVVHGHRLVGKTFLVPVSSGTLATDGTLDSIAGPAIATAAQALITGGGNTWLVWSRPLHDAQGVLIRAGSSATIVSATVPDRVSVLRSRRD